MKRALAALALILPLLVGPLLTRFSAGAPVESPHGDLAIDCDVCHTPKGWSSVDLTRFKHSETGFRLEGAHARTRCRACHAVLIFSHVGTACADCHKDAHRGELGTRCDDCHSPHSWGNQREMFAAHNRTRFPLLAAHASLDCQACHKGQGQAEYALTPVECEGCHLETWNRTSDPNHAALGFSTRCVDCHGWAPRGWRPVTSFAHPATFPLRGGHAGHPCSACHTGGYAGLARECVSCHESDFLRTTNPNHAASRFPRRCETCHDVDGWRPARFDHSLTRFPLTGEHARVECERCHPGGRYAGTPLECVACHRGDYDAAQNPNHVASGFPTGCASCHSTTAWRPATFDHNLTRFPLTGAHTRASCESCHVGGRYSGTPTDCYACHRSDYDGTQNPNHQAASFPTRCETCHTTAAWRPASFDHDGRYFPIYSGRHRGEWSTCADCHVNPGDYRVFECINCHAHSRAEMDDKHQDVGGYLYSSPSCYSCHPQGRADD